MNTLVVTPGNHTFGDLVIRVLLAPWLLSGCW
jgi:hypothetical protein